MKPSSRFFENRDCEYFPCHKDVENLNCLFCYCPLHKLPSCPGKPEYLMVQGREIKDCSNCTFPHEPDNYDIIMAFLAKNM